ncbi:hypothetical protein H5410_002704 [Solanum commersonii]|uniref:At2g35280-like TPR domain-containing protein n=1 Tax=Solanum commersonii TaxID=4109 RepID=A0A9J6B306_SOLCO|nr:hypothetical protein H5410_002704 [Solanum commersonii]
MFISGVQLVPEVVKFTSSNRLIYKRHVKSTPHRIGCKVSYWKIYKGMKHAKSNVRGTHEHRYAVLNAYLTHFYKATKAYDICEFNDHFNQIRDLVPNVAETLERIGFHTWSKSFCPGNRYNNMTPNIAESVNSMFDVEREFPIVALFDEINRRFALLFHQRCMELFDFFNRNDPTALGMINQAADGGHIGASYVLAIISIFNSGESMREGGMWVPEPNLLGGRPICCTVHRFERIGRRNGWAMGSDNEDDIRCDLCSCDLELDYVVKFLPYTTVWVLNQVANEPSVYQKYDFFNCSDSNGLEMLSQPADGGHIGASYVLAIISFFNGGESMRKGLMFISNMTPLKLRICREKL